MRGVTGGGVHVDSVAVGGRGGVACDFCGVLIETVVEFGCIV